LEPDDDVIFNLLFSYPQAPAPPVSGGAMTRQKRHRRAGARGIVKYCRINDGRLVRSLADKRRVKFWLEPGGIPVREIQAHRAIFFGELTREPDGFFGVNQTWRAKP
jgi:hypothetical protein